MAKFNELTNEEALDKLADLIEPLTAILTNEDVRSAARKSKLHGVQAALKNCGHEVIQALALYNGVPAEQYECNGMAIVAQVMEFISNPDLQAVFSSLGQTTED